jgi:hypothetical protein
MSMHTGGASRLVFRSLLPSLTSRSRTTYIKTSTPWRMLTQMPRQPGGSVIFCTNNTMAASATVFPPYWSEQDNRQTAEYQSISSHPLVQNFSFEELRLEDYNVGCKAQEPILEPHESSNLMATRQLFAPSTNQTLKPIRAVADRTQKYGLFAIG